MTLRVSTVRRGDKVYRYTQLVESFRRERDGKPTVRVIASLGVLDDTTIANIKAALAASRTGEALVLPVSGTRVSTEAEVVQNLEYLDLAVLLRLWDDLGLSSLVRENVPALSAMRVEVERVVCALVLQRCVAPASKLAAERWFPDTALPECMAFAPGTFNNARVHRALAALEAGDAALQARLPTLLASKQGQFGALFIDATDTWFVGQGPPLAAKGIDKHGVYRRRVGIVLLCDARGFPLKWATLTGKYHDATALLDMAAKAATLPWLQGKPVVLDRAVGSAAHIDQLDAAKVRFVTALPYTEFVTCGAPFDWEKLGQLQHACDQSPATVPDVARAAGFTDVRKGSFVQDLGPFSKRRSTLHHPSPAVAALQIVQFLRENPELTVKGLGERLGRSRGQVHRDLHLGKLTPALQDRVLAGEADRVNVKDLSRVAKLAPAEQPAAFARAILEAPATRAKRAQKSALLHPPEALTVRGVLTFSPEVYARNVAAEAETKRRLAARVAAINAALAGATCRRTDHAVLAEIGTFIHRRQLGDVLTPEIQTVEGKRQLVVRHESTPWVRRRRSYGLMLLVAHPDIKGTATDIVDLYFGRDAAEKDFQTIKSALELRPVRHRTDVKLKAHVSLCMLALVLDRALGIRLKAAGSTYTPARAYELLRSIHLNRLKQDGREFYTITTPPKAVSELLTALGMNDLAQTAKIRAAITPR